MTGVLDVDETVVEQHEAVCGREPTGRGEEERIDLALSQHSPGRILQSFDQLWWSGLPEGGRRFGEFVVGDCSLFEPLAGLH